MDDTKGIVRLNKPRDQVVDANSLNDILTEYCSLWRGIGLNLGLRQMVLDNIEYDHNELRRRFEVTLEKWQRQEGDRATWGALELAITNANRADLSFKRLEEVPFESKQDSNGQQVQHLSDLEPDAGNLSVEALVLEQTEQPSNVNHDHELPVQSEDIDDGPVHTPTEESVVTTIFNSTYHPVIPENTAQSTNIIGRRNTESHTNKTPVVGRLDMQHLKKRQIEKPQPMATALVKSTPNHLGYRHDELERCISLHTDQTNQVIGQMRKMFAMFVVTIQEQQTQQRLTTKDNNWKVSKEEYCLALACCGIVVMFLTTYCVTLLLLCAIICVFTVR